MRPDKPDTTYTVLNPPDRYPPKIIFGTTALKWIDAMVELHQLEIGFYAAVDEREDYTFFIRNVFYPKHSEVNGATCEISPEGETLMMDWLLEHNRADDIEKYRLWGHSHHSMGTSASGQDETQAMERMTATQSFLIRVICNKPGEMSVSFFDFKNQIRYDHVKWTAENDTSGEYNTVKTEKIAAVMADDQKTPKEKIKEINGITVCDDESAEIKIKIIELKNTNLPAVIPAWKKNRSGGAFQGEYNYERDWKGNNKEQTNLFKNKKGKKEKKQNTTSHHSRNEEIETGFDAALGYDDSIFDDKEISEMLENWEQSVVET